MSKFETSTVTIASGRRCQDRVKVVHFADGIVIAVADGAGGTGGGDQAADTVIQEIVASASLEHDADQWCRLLRQIDHRVGGGESTGVVVAVSPRRIVGASVGDSQAWLISDGLVNLTANQVRKPLLGSGDAIPVGFIHGPSSGLLLVATDGFCNYVRRDKLIQEILSIDFAVLARRLVEMVRLPSGDLWDDIGIVACRPRRNTSPPVRYDLDAAE
jgi:serine/threonine protein phosphatase PrpC